MTHKKVHEDIKSNVNRNNFNNKITDLINELGLK